jgi:hypothetical protein
MNAEMIDELTRIDPREVDAFAEEINAIMAEEAERLEEERKRINCLAEAFKW